MLGRYPKLKVVLAHFAGSTHYYNDALEVLQRFPHAYVGTAMVLNRLISEEAASFIRKIGADRVIFGTDYPGHDIGKEIKLVNGLPLTKEEKIFSQNVIKAFNLT